MTQKLIIQSLLLAVFTVTIGIAHAQTKFGIKAGIRYSNVTEKAENGIKSNTRSQPGLLVGLTADFHLVSDFFIQPSLVYVRKGFQQQIGGFYDSAINFKVRVDYMELPVNFFYKPKLGIGNVLVGFGPYMAYGFGGNWKSDTDIVLGDIRMDGEGSVALRNDGSVHNDSEYIYGKPLDYGVNGVLGYEFREILSLQITGLLGIANIVPHFDGYQTLGSLRNKGMGISVGYKF